MRSAARWHVGVKGACTDGRGKGVSQIDVGIRVSTSIGSHVGKGVSFKDLQVGTPVLLRIEDF